MIKFLFSSWKSSKENTCPEISCTKREAEQSPSFRGKKRNGLTWEGGVCVCDLFCLPCVLRQFKCGIRPPGGSLSLFVGCVSQSARRHQLLKVGRGGCVSEETNTQL